MNEKVKNAVAAFNMKRAANVGKKFSRAEMLEELKVCGFSIPQVKGIMSKYIDKKPSGKDASKVYLFKETPLNIVQVENLKSHPKVIPFSESKAIEILQAKGFNIQKPVGFDMERFKKDHPDLYSKYLLYENIAK